MNALLLADYFRALFAADPVFAGRACVNDQDCAPIVRPSLIFLADTAALSQAGSAFSYHLVISVEDAAERPEASGDTPQPPDPAEIHAEAVQLVREKLFGLPGHADDEAIDGAPSPRGAAFRAALQVGSIYDFAPGYCAVDCQPGLETTHFRTPLAISGASRSL